MPETGPGVEYSDTERPFTTKFLFEEESKLINHFKERGRFMLVI